MAVEDLLRLAWQADRDGRVNRRDSLLTLAAAEAAPDVPWLAACRQRLIRSRPEHPFAAFPTVAAALADPRIIRTLARLRDAYPTGRVRHLLGRDAVHRGAFTGREPTRAVVLDDHFPTPARRAPHRSAARAVPAPASVLPDSPAATSISRC